MRDDEVQLVKLKGSGKHLDENNFKASILYKTKLSDRDLKS